MSISPSTLPRSQELAILRHALEFSRAVALVGPRQCGKTTLAREFVAPESPNYFDLEDEADLARLENAAFALGSLSGLVVIDEVQRRPDLFPTLRVLIDRLDNKTQFLILGSASPDLLRQSSETLAGRIATIELTGFSLGETGATSMRRLWLRGGFPRSFLAATEAGSLFWRKNFSRDFLERDLGLLGLEIAPTAIGRLWKMLSHYHGQNLNNAELSRSLGITAPTAKRYVDVLTGAFMVRQLQPWFENIKKRQVKSPKIYFRDSGVLHSQLGIANEAELLVHPKLGASWEGFVIEQALQYFKPDDQYFWSTQSDAELDLLMFIDGKRIGLECKFNDKPQVTASMRSAMKLLKLEYLYIAYTGTRRYMLDEKIEVLPVSAFANIRDVSKSIPDSGNFQGQAIKKWHDE
jgi:predicted AAA+ superfamily ATPase